MTGLNWLKKTCVYETGRILGSKAAWTGRVKSCQFKQRLQTGRTEPSSGRRIDLTNSQLEKYIALKLKVKPGSTQLILK